MALEDTNIDTKEINDAIAKKEYIKKYHDDNERKGHRLALLKLARKGLEKSLERRKYANAMKFYKIPKNQYDKFVNGTSSSVKLAEISITIEKEKLDDMINEISKRMPNESKLTMIRTKNNKGAFFYELFLTAE